MDGDTATRFQRAVVWAVRAVSTRTSCCGCVVSIVLLPVLTAGLAGTYVVLT